MTSRLSIDSSAFELFLVSRDQVLTHCGISDECNATFNLQYYCTAFPGCQHPVRQDSMPQTPTDHGVVDDATPITEKTSAALSGPLGLWVAWPSICKATITNAFGRNAYKGSFFGTRPAYAGIRATGN